MKAPARLLVSACCACVLAGAQPVRADEGGAGDMKAAAALFESGKALLNAGKYAEACPVLEEAQRRVLGIGVTLYLADCYEHTGRLTYAWEQFDRARQLAESKHDARAGIARERAQRLWPRLPRLLVVVPPSAEVPGLVVTEDGVPVDRGAYNTERPAAPGTHRFHAEAPDRTPWERSVDVPVFPATVGVEVPPLAASEPSAVPSVSPPPPVASSGGPPPPQAARPMEETPRLLGMSAQRIGGIAVIGVGVAWLAVSAVLGLEAKARMDDSNASGACQPDNRCDAAGLAERADAITKATWSTIAATAGLACAAGGAGIYLTARDGTLSGVALSARSQPGGASLLLEHRW